MILTAVDDDFLPEALSLIKSCVRHAPGQRFYLFLVNSTEDRISEVRGSHPNLIVEHVQWPYDAERWRGLMCSARSGPILHVLEEYKEPTLYLDSDMLVMGPLDELFGELETYDLLVQYRPEGDVLGAGGTRKAGRFNSGVIAVRPSDEGIEFARQYDRRIREWIDTGKPLCRYDEDCGIETCIDQEFLYLVYEEFKERLRFAPLAIKFNDSGLRPGSVIWHGKGVARKRLPYVLGKLSYENLLIYWIFSLVRFPFCFAYYHLRQWASIRHL
jgi:hypothetical protein